MLQGWSGSTVRVWDDVDEMADIPDNRAIFGHVDFLGVGATSLKEEVGRGNEPRYGTMR
jgi:hypothetical protein